MITARWRISRAIPAIIAVALLAVASAGCGQESSSTRGELAGSSAGQVATTTPGRAMATPAPSGSPTPVATAQPPGAAVPEPVARALSNVYANLDWFEGVVTVTTMPGASNSVATTFRQWFKQPNMHKLETINSTSSDVVVGTTLIYDGQTLTLFDPAEDQVTEIQNVPELVLFLNLPQERLSPTFLVLQTEQFLSSIAPQSTVTVVGPGMVANRQATIVDLVPRESTPRFESVRMWLDSRTLAPLRVEAIGNGGTVLLNIEYSQFDPVTPVGEDVFTFTPPTTAQVVEPTPDDVATIAGFQRTTLQDAESAVGFPILQPRTLPSGASLQSIRSGTFQGVTVVALLFGTAQEVSTVLIEKPASLNIPTIRGAEAVTIDGFSGEVYQSPDIVVIDWVQGDTSLTLTTTLTRDEALEIARSVQ